MTTIKEIVDEIAEISKKNFQLNPDDILPGLSEDEILEFERQNNFVLPQDVKEYLKAAGGENEETEDGLQHGLFLGLVWLPIDAIKRELKIWKEVIEQNPEFEEEEYEVYPKDAIQPKYVDANGWVGLATDGSGNSIGIDLNPGPRGKAGQVVIWGRDYNDERLVAFDTWKDFIVEVLTKLNDKSFYKVDEEYQVYDLEPEVNFLDFIYERKLEEYKEAEASNKTKAL